jgi:hypothetical protein
MKKTLLSLTVVAALSALSGVASAGLYALSADETTSDVTINETELSGVEAKNGFTATGLSLTSISGGQYTLRLKDVGSSIVVWSVQLFWGKNSQKSNLSGAASLAPLNC